MHANESRWNGMMPCAVLVASRDNQHTVVGLAVMLAFSVYNPSDARLGVHWPIRYPLRMHRVLTDYHRVALTVPAGQLSSMAPKQGGHILATALRSVFVEPGFRERVTVLSRRLRAQPQTPLAQARVLL